MNTREATDCLNRLKRRYLAVRLLEIIMLAAGTVLLTAAIARLWVAPTPALISGSLLSGITVFLLRSRHYKLLHLDNHQFACFLNIRYPQLQESADLMIMEERGMTGLQLLQKRKVLREFDKLYPDVRLPHQLIQSTGIFAGCSLLYVVLSSFAVIASLPVQSDTTAGKLLLPLKRDSTASLRSLSVMVSPPAYTRLKSFTAGGTRLVYPEGSNLHWAAEFSRKVQNVKVIFSGPDSSNFTPSGNSWFLDQSKPESGFYQLQWEDQAKTRRSDYFEMTTTQDLPPRIVVRKLDQFTQLRVGDNLRVEVNSVLSDDYGLQDAQIIATVSKGSGESVKFREEKLRFSSPAAFSGRRVDASRTLDLTQLGLEPGDELYFYVEALDSKAPLPNRNRTETFFIALQDTTTEIVSADAGLGVDLMPEYFRSQRQIIIDTEKLLREQKQMTKQVFNSTSNELGYDQKVLRLRYGQFLGEEAESGIGLQVATPAVAEESDSEEEDVTKAYGHKHDTDNEHNLVEKKGEKSEGHEHAEEVKEPGKEDDPLKAFTHSHDNTDEATFFDQSIKAKLKAALTLMWDAELHLRLYEPSRSLPYQYKILGLLKEISNDSRIYVHRTGFDPPPLKEERRLTADLTEVKNSNDQYSKRGDEKYPAARQALALTGRLLLNENNSLAPEEAAIFHRAGYELAEIALANPSRYLRGLSLLKSLSEKQVAAGDFRLTLTEVQKILYRALPPSPVSPSGRIVTQTKLDETFLENLDKVKHE